MTWHWASRMVCNFLQFILFASYYHSLVHREFHSLTNFVNWVFNFSKSFNWMISNSGTASRTSFFTSFPRWLQIVHFLPWTSSAADHFSKQFPKLATPISDMSQYKKYAKLSVYISKNLQWLNKQVKRVLRHDTRTVSRLNNFQLWLQSWRYHYLFEVV